MTQTDRLKYLRIVLLVVGVILTFGFYPLTIVWPSGWTWHTGHSEYLQMIIGIYATLGVFLIIASRDPLAHRSLIWFTVWSSVVHGGIMMAQSFSDPHRMGHLWGDVPALFVVAAVLGYSDAPNELITRGIACSTELTCGISPLANVTTMDIQNLPRFDVTTLTFCTRCGHAVPAYEPSTVSLSDAFEYGTPPSDGDLQAAPHYWCSFCAEHWLAVNMMDTGFGCPSCNTFMPRFVRYCGACGQSMRRAPAEPANGRP